MLRTSRLSWSVVLTLLLCLVARGQALAPQPVLQANDLIAICGDSITEQKEYSVDIECYLLMCQPTAVRTCQFGWSGDSMGWLFSRNSQRDILAVHPTIATTCYGMNDGGYKAVTPETVKKYSDGMTELVKQFKAGGMRQVIVGSPGAVDSNTFRNNPELAATYNQTLAALRDAAKQVAEEQGCVFANVHDPMMDVMAKAKAKYGEKYHVAGGDGVHPAKNGQLVMACAFLKAMGCDGNIGTISFDYAANKADASAGHKIVSAADGTIEVESTRYPYCFFGQPSDPGATTGVIEFFPFNQDLNRFRLVVTNAPEGKLKVTWGNASKEFTAQQLKDGINLAAEFLDNPFCEPFKQVEGAVRAQQNYETSLYKGFFANLPAMQSALAEDDPQAAESLAKVQAAMIKRDAKLAAASAATVTPVRHTIKIEVVK